jgi:hypothetical protein
MFWNCSASTEPGFQLFAVIPPRLGFLFVFGMYKNADGARRAVSDL